MQTYTLAFRAMGCRVNIWLETNEDGAACLQPVPDWLETLEASLSRFRAESELSRLNARPRTWTDVSAILHTALSEARRAAQFSEGMVTPLVLPALISAGYDRSFDQLRDTPPRPAAPVIPGQWHTIQLADDPPRVWLPGPVDLGGTAKGWAAAVIADQLAAYGPCLVDLGGDIVGRGKAWPVEVHDPLVPATPFTLFTLTDSTVATSGTDYRRWGSDAHHIIDPRSGQPAESDLISVTVVHPDPVLAEAAAKTALILGSRDGLAWLTRQPGAAALAFDYQGQVLATENFQDLITQGASL